MIDEEGSIPKLEAKHHMPIFNLREILRQRYEEQAYASSMQAEVVNKVTIIPGEVERYYKHIDKDSLPLIADQYVYAQITRFPRTMTEAKQRTRERLLDLRERVITGQAKFENLARMYSQRWPSSSRARYRRWSRPSTASTSSSPLRSVATSTGSATSCCVRSIRPTSSPRSSTSSTAW